MHRGRSSSTLAMELNPSKEACWEGEIEAVEEGVLDVGAARDEAGRSSERRGGVHPARERWHRAARTR